MTLAYAPKPLANAIKLRDCSSTSAIRSASLNGLVVEPCVPLRMPGWLKRI